MNAILSALARGFLLAGLSVWLCAAPSAAAQSERPLKIGLSAEFGMKDSHSAQSIEKGILLAIDEINAAGGVLGRKLVLEKRDDRGVTARALDNFAELAADKDVVAVFCGRFSPAALELALVANRLGLLLLDPWAAADGVTLQEQPNYVFRLSLTDSWAIETLLDHARNRSLRRLAVFLPNTAWGRSSDAALFVYARSFSSIEYSKYWYNYGDTDFSVQLKQAKNLGAQAILMIVNAPEGANIVRQMAALPVAQRLPILSHWGITGSNFPALTGDALKAVDLVVVQTFTFNGARGTKARTVAAGLKRLFSRDTSTLQGQVGFAHAYDFTHLLAQAIRKAGSADRAAIRIALERIETHAGLLRTYRRPFSVTDHEALDRSQLFIARFDTDGSLVRIPGK